MFWKEPEGIELHNGVSNKNMEFPAYDLSKKETGIDLYFSNEGDVIIVGTVDNNYIYWLSVTKTEDTKLNEEIFNHVASVEWCRVSRLSRTLKVKGIEYEELAGYYRVQLKRSHEKGMAWKTPFGHYYGEKQRKRNGSFFAKDVKGFVTEINKRCELRECGGRYAEILKNYTEILREATTYDYTVQQLEKLLKAEDYLCLSRRDNVREPYLECCAKCSELYNQYMTEAR